MGHLPLKFEAEKGRKCQEREDTETIKEKKALKSGGKTRQGKNMCDYERTGELDHR